jgi:hypothetical protein
MKKVFITGLFAFFIALLSGYAQSSANAGQRAVVFSFAPGSDVFALHYADNSLQMQRLVEWVKACRNSIYADTMAVFVKGFGDGDLSLAVTRSNRVKAALITYAGMKEEFFITSNRSSAFDGKDHTVCVDVRIPLPEERLPENAARRRANNEPVFGDAPAKEISAVVQPQPQPKEESNPAEQPAKPQGTRSDAQPVAGSDSGAIPTNNKQGFSIRTNLIYWLAAVPNLGIEWKTSGGVGIFVNGLWSNWVWSNGEKQHRTWMLGPEVRCYLGESKNWFIGAEGHLGEFNFKFNDTGYQGGLAGGGLTGGYKLRLSKVFDLDFSLGLGYTRLEYDTYYRSAGYMVKKETGLEKDFFGPTQAGVSLSWKIK